MKLQAASKKKDKRFSIEYGKVNPKKYFAHTG
jgi:hypothetical protein